MKTAKRLELAVQKILRKNNERVGANEKIESEREKEFFQTGGENYNLDTQNETKDSQSIFEDLSSSAPQLEENEQMKKERQKFKTNAKTKQTEAEVGVDIQLKNARLDEAKSKEQTVDVFWPHKARERSELTTHESILTKINPTFTFTNKGDAIESAQIVFVKPDTMEASINLISSTAGMQKEEEIIPGPKGKGNPKLFKFIN